MIEMKMFESKLTQTKLAAKIGIGQSKVLEILSGKRKPDLLVRVSKNITLFFFKRHTEIKFSYIHIKTLWT